jgi:hypothetical protein
MSVNLLRHHLFMFCYAFGSYIFLCHPFYCVIQFTVCGALLFCKNSYYLSHLHLPPKISKTLVHLATRARGLEGEHVKLLSREVL